MNRYLEIKEHRILSNNSSPVSTVENLPLCKGMHWLLHWAELQ